MLQHKYEEDIKNQDKHIFKSFFDVTCVQQRTFLAPPSFLPHIIYHHLKHYFKGEEKFKTALFFFTLAINLG